MENLLMGGSPQELLERVADEQTALSVAKFSADSQQYCQNHCQKQGEEAYKEDDSLSEESLKAIERQCNKLCIRKFFKAYQFQ